MKTFNTEASWGWPARALHWIVAAIIIHQLVSGLWMAVFATDLAARIAQAQVHKSFGFVVFLLAVLRIVWRLANRAPAEAPTATGFERLAAQAAHLGLYALMIWLPVSGWLMASASPLQDYPGIPNRVFGLFDMPDPFVPGSQALSDALHWSHTIGAVALAALLAAHAGAALFHHFVRRDDVLARMSWGR